MKRIQFFSILQILFIWSSLSLYATSSEGASPRLEWTYKTKSNLYAPALVADVNAAPGQEVIFSESESRRLHCVDAGGHSLWELDGGWKKRLASAASLSRTARPGKSTLLLGNGDGSLCCIDAENGVVLWRKPVGGIEWGNALWADLDGDGQDEAVAGTEKEGVVALKANGDVLWTTKTLPSGRGLTITCPIAATDLDGDKKCEIFGIDNWGPFCLNPDGTFRWYTPTGSMFISAPTLAYLDESSNPSVICCSKDLNAVNVFDAMTGALKWSSPMLAFPNTYSASSIAVGTLIGNEHNTPDIVVGDNAGNLYCLSSDGQILWTFSVNDKVSLAATLGDVDGDDEVEVLVSSADNFLYCLNSRGHLKWKYETGLRLMNPPTIADVDGDGQTEILFGGSDGNLRCLTLDGRYMPELMLWPSQRFDVAQTGYCPRRVDAKSGKPVLEERKLIANSTFAAVVAEPETPPEIKSLNVKQPMGWSVETPSMGTCALDADHPFNNTPMVHVMANPDVTMRLVSVPVSLDSNLLTVTSHVRVFGEGASVELVWLGTEGVLEQTLVPCINTRPAESSSTATSWDKQTVLSEFGNEMRPPAEAKWVYLKLVTKGSASTWWSCAELTGRYAHSRQLRVLVNQAGYDCGAPKRFTVQSNFMGESAAFELLADDGTVAYKGLLKSGGRITGAYGPDWGWNYWRGDFTDFNTPGTYRIRVTLEDQSDISWPTEIAENLFWTKTTRPAYRFFYYQRCGMAIPGFHSACHLDDAVSSDGKRQYDLTGGWHDAGDYNKYYNAPYVVGLARAYRIEKTLFDKQDEDGNGLSDLFDEVLWGGDHSRRMIAPDGSAYGQFTSGYGFWGPPEIETDNKPGTGDERPITGADTGNDPGMHAVAMTQIARFAKDKKPWIDAADRSLQYMASKDIKGVLPLCAALDLFEITKEQKYADSAKVLFAGCWPPDFSKEEPFTQRFCCTVDAVEQYDRLFGEGHREALKKILVDRAEFMLTLANNPFGVYTFGPKEKPNFFDTPAGKVSWHVGTSSHLLTAAALMAQAYRYQPDPRYLAFVYDQFNWTLGNNPYDLSLMEGIGSRNPPTFHHRFMFGVIARGAVPGGVVNGITWVTFGDDRPYFDMRSAGIPDYQPNEVWLPHNTAYLTALVNLQQARATKP